MKTDNVNNDSLSGAMANLIDVVKKSIDNCIPCKVTAVNATRTRVSVSPMIKMVSKSNTDIQRAEIHNIPVHTLGGGDAFISFHIAKGDFGWIEASDRDISLFLQSYQSSIPTTARKHSFSDARFIPDIMRDFNVSGDVGKLVIANRSGAHKITLDNNGIIVTSTNDVDINGAKITPAGDVITAKGVSLDNHTHPYDWTDGAGASDTEIPNT